MADIVKSNKAWQAVKVAEGLILLNCGETMVDVSPTDPAVGEAVIQLARGEQFDPPPAGQGEDPDGGVTVWVRGEEGELLVYSRPV